MIVSTEMKGDFATIEAEVPLAETFGYSTDLRSMTQGQGTFTMEFAKYRRVPASIQEEIIADKKKKQLVGRQVRFPATLFNCNQPKLRSARVGAFFVGVNRCHG